MNLGSCIHLENWEWGEPALALIHSENADVSCPVASDLRRFTSGAWGDLGVMAIPSARDSSSVYIGPEGLPFCKLPYASDTDV